MVMLRVEVSEVMLMAGRVDVAVRVVLSVVVVEVSTASMVDVRVWIMIDVFVKIGWVSSSFLWSCRRRCKCLC